MKFTPGILHLIAIIGFLGLFGLIMLWNTALTPPSKIPTALLILISATPLMLPMRGFLSGKKKSCAWMAYVSIIYSIHGCIEAYASPSTRNLAFLEIILSLMVFFASSFYIRSLKSSTQDGRATPDQV